MGYRFSSSLRLLCQGLLGAVLLFGICHAHASPAHPLEPVDTSSPRATLTSYITEMSGVWRVFRDEYWDAPTYEIYQDITSRAGRILRTLDLSEVAPSARIEVGHQAATLLYETLARIELPPMEEIPGASAFEDTEGPAKWTIPHTAITIARVTEGVRKGEFLFSPGTVERVQEFYQRTRSLPYLREVPIENTAGLRQLHGGWWVATATIERLPGWMKQVVFDHAVWKWGAFAVLLVVVAVLVLLVYRITRRAVQANPVTD